MRCLAAIALALLLAAAAAAAPRCPKAVRCIYGDGVLAEFTGNEQSRSDGHVWGEYRHFYYDENYERGEHRFWAQCPECD